MRHLLLFSAYFVPALAFAAAGLEGIMETILGLLDVATVLIVALSVVYFLYGIFKYVAADSDENRSAGRAVMIHGIIAIFVMVSVWGLVNVLSETFDLEQGAAGVPEMPDSY